MLRALKNSFANAKEFWTDPRNPFTAFFKTRYNFKNPTISNVAVWFATLSFLILAVLGGFLLAGSTHVANWVMEANAYAWIVSNLLVAYIGIGLIVFIVGYYYLFDPRKTTAGQQIFRFAASLGGVIGLIFISLFIDPTVGREWFTYPGDVLIWRPIARLVAYTYIAYTITGLAVLLFIRRFYPEKIRTSNDKDLVQPRKMD